MTLFRNTLICPYCEHEMNDMEINAPSVGTIEDEMTAMEEVKCVECWRKIKVEICYTCEFHWYKN